MYVTNRGSDTLSVINSTTSTLVKIVSTGGIAPSSIIYNPVNNYLYVANTGSDTVSVINGTTNDVVKTISTGSRPIGITYNEYDGNIYVANSINGTVSVIDGLLNTVIDTIDSLFSLLNKNWICFLRHKDDFVNLNLLLIQKKIINIFTSVFIVGQYKK